MLKIGPVLVSIIVIKCHPSSLLCRASYTGHAPNSAPMILDILFGSSSSSFSFASFVHLLALFTFTFQLNVTECSGKPHLAFSRLPTVLSDLSLPLLPPSFVFAPRLPNLLPLRGPLLFPRMSILRSPLSLK